MPSNVLVVDDDIAICEALERNLRNEGFIVRVSHNGEDAILAIEQETQDLQKDEEINDGEGPTKT